MNLLLINVSVHFSSSLLALSHKPTACSKLLQNFKFFFHNTSLPSTKSILFTSFYVNTDYSQNLHLKITCIISHVKGQESGSSLGGYHWVRVIYEVAIYLLALAVASSSDSTGDLLSHMAVGKAFWRLSPKCQLLFSKTSSPRASKM